MATEDSYFSEIPDKNSGIEHQVFESRMKEQLLEYCKNLDPPYGEVAVHYYYEEQTISEISKKLNRNEKTVRTQVYRAKGMLQRLYRKKGNL